MICSHLKIMSWRSRKNSCGLTNFEKKDEPGHSAEVFNQPKSTVTSKGKFPGCQLQECSLICLDIRVALIMSPL